MNSLKISSALLAFRASTLSEASLGALVASMIAGLDPVLDETIIRQWEDWGALPFNSKEYKQGWKKYHDRGRLPPQMTAKNSRKQDLDALLAEVERIVNNPAALWGRQDGTKTYLKQEFRKQSSPEKNAERQLNNQRAGAKLAALRAVPAIDAGLNEEVL